MDTSPRSTQPQLQPLPQPPPANEITDFDQCLGLACLHGSSYTDRAIAIADEPGQRPEQAAHRQREAYKAGTEESGPKQASRAQRLKSLIYALPAGKDRDHWLFEGLRSLSMAESLPILERVQHAHDARDNALNDHQRFEGNLQVSRVATLYQSKVDALDKASRYANGAYQLCDLNLQKSLVLSGPETGPRNLDSISDALKYAEAPRGAEGEPPDIWQLRQMGPVYLQAGTLQARGIEIPGRAGEDFLSKGAEIARHTRNPQLEEKFRKKIEGNRDNESRSAPLNDIPRESRGRAIGSKAHVHAVRFVR
ncbi:MAG TPA: hypothetical protein VGZ00_13430 [Candidatus Baltobacteraceae bacterium]|jgi:hypothetical protein|nr:hypothetical protein [Candidatus Baltobacteraceae bacterium]